MICYKEKTPKALLKEKNQKNCMVCEKKFTTLRERILCRTLNNYVISMQLLLLCQKITPTCKLKKNDIKKITIKNYTFCDDFVSDNIW